MTVGYLVERCDAVLHEVQRHIGVAALIDDAAGDKCGDPREVLVERYDTYPGELYHFVIFEMKDINGNIGLGIGHTKTAVHKFVLKVGAELGSVTMKIPSFFMGKIIVTLFLLADNPCGMKPSITMSSVLLRHPSSALFLEKCRKSSVSAVFEGWVQMNPLMNPVGSNAEGKLNCINAVVITHKNRLFQAVFLIFMNFLSKYAV